jgi:L-fuculose-phosphate aldolase
MHLEVYRQRQDVQAVIHAHPPLAVAFSIAGMSLARCILPEVIVALGGIPTTEYATPSTEEVPESIRSAIRDYDAVVLAHHGSLTVGKDLWEAYMRLEKVEHTAHITLAAHQLGRVETLSPDDVEKLVAMRREALQREGRDLCEGCAVCTLGGPNEETVRLVSESGGPTDDEAFVQQIAGAVMRSMQQT